MTGVELPALRGDNVLGFMAALGVLRLLDQELGAARSTLCWPNGAHSAAVIETSVATDVDSLAARLFDVVEGCKESGELVPGVAGLPLSSSGGDPMNKLSFRDGRGLSQSFADNDVAAEWLATMVGVSGPDENDELSRSRWWSVGPGPVTIAGTLAKALDVSPMPIREALSRLTAAGALAPVSGRSMGVPKLRKAEFDYIVCDSPAGIEKGAKMALYFADEAIVTTNPEVSSVRDSDRILGILQSESKRSKMNEEPVKEHLLITRYNPSRVQDGQMLSVDDIVDLLAIPLLGIIPESPLVLESSNAGKPVILDDESEAGQAYADAIDRLLGETKPHRFMEVPKRGLLKRIFG